MSSRPKNISGGTGCDGGNGFGMLLSLVSSIDMYFANQTHLFVWVVASFKVYKDSKVWRSREAMMSHHILQPQSSQILLNMQLVRTSCGRNMDVHESLVSCSVLNIVL